MVLTSFLPTGVVRSNLEASAAFLIQPTCRQDLGELKSYLGSHQTKLTYQVTVSYNSFMYLGIHLIKTC